MKAKMLKIAGVKSEAAFYKKFPNQEAFMKVHGKEFKKAQIGANLEKAQFGKPITYDQSIEMPDHIQNPYYGTAQQNASKLYNHSNQFDVVGDSLNASELISSADDIGSKMPGAQQIVGAATDIIGAAGAFKEQRNQLKNLKQQKGVADVNLKAAESIDVDAKRQNQDTFAKQRRSLMQPVTGENLFPVNGVGTNVLQLKEGGEIQNTYDPNTLFDDLGYEPLNDSDLKQYKKGGFVKAQAGFSSFMGAGGTDFANKAVLGAFNNNAGSQMGTAVGGALKMIPGVGPVVGAIAAPILGAIGGGLDQAFGDAGKIKKEQAGLNRTMTGLQNVQSTKNLQQQNQSYMKDGGWVSNDWQPQVIASFGGLDEQEVYDYAHEGMDTLRAGGHLRDYTPPSNRAMETYEDGGEIQSYGLGGELQTHWGGGAETISRNPYLPGTGETVMFRGKSHEEYSPNGETGIGVTYGGNPVEVERGEPMVELEDGGEIDPQTGEPRKSGVVFGNLKIPNQYIDMLGDTKAKGKKFKNYVADLSKTEDKQNRLIEKSTSELSSFVPKNSFDKLKLSALQANLQGANMKLKDIADKKINAATLQNAINDTAEEQGLVADDLAKGKIKTAKFGGKFTQAQNGINQLSDEELIQQADMEGGELDEVVIQGKPKTRSMPYGTFKLNPKNLPVMNNVTIDQVAKLPSSFGTYDEKVVEPKINNFDIDPYITGINQLMPYLRPTDQEPLDASQLYGEMNALASNQLEPVQANFYHPELSTPYDISRQAAKNDLIAQTRAAQRQVGYNPAAQAMIAAQSYGEMQKLNEADFLANQAMKDKVYAENRAALNDAKLKNLAIADQQYTRQSEAKSNTKATTQAALNSIAEKFAKNKLENRQLGVMENMYNYRYDSKGRAINMNPLAQFNTQMGGKGGSSKGKGLAEGKGFTYDENGNIVGVRSIGKDDVARNGSIVKSYKNL